MLIQIAVLAWIFLGEQLDTRELIGLGLSTVGVMVFQLYRGGVLDHSEDDSRSKYGT